MPTKAVTGSECDWECGPGIAAAMVACYAGGLSPVGVLGCFAGLAATASTQSCRSCIEYVMKSYQGGDYIPV